MLLCRDWNKGKTQPAEPKNGLSNTVSQSYTPQSLVILPVTAVRPKNHPIPGRSTLNACSKSAAHAGKKPNCNASVPLESHPKATNGNHGIANLCHPVLKIYQKSPKGGFGLHSIRLES